MSHPHSCPFSENFYHTWSCAPYFILLSSLLLWPIKDNVLPVCMHPKSLQSCLTLHCLCTVARQAPLSMGILQARILERVAMPSSRGSSRPSDRTRISHICTGRQLLYHQSHLGSSLLLAGLLTSVPSSCRALLSIPAWSAPSLHSGLCSVSPPYHRSPWPTKSTLWRLDFYIQKLDGILEKEYSPGDFLHIFLAKRLIAKNNS